MGFIDSDTHVFESEQTWSYLSEKDKQYAPLSLNSAWGPAKQMWFLDGIRIPRGVATLVGHPEWPVRILEDIPGRVRWMDALGVDYQIVISSFFIAAIPKFVEQQIALCHSYNMWMADMWRESGGRLVWVMASPFLDIDAAIKELTWARQNGCVGVQMRACEHDRTIGDPYFDPLFAAAQDAGMAIAIHVGNWNTPIYNQQPGMTIYHHISIIGAMYQIIARQLPQKFPNLRFGLLENGCDWIPFVLRELSRAGMTAAGSRNQSRVMYDYLPENNIYTACQITDDIAHVLQYTGPDRLVFGTDFGHNDIGSDIEGHRILLRRQDVDREVLRRIADDNGRALYGLPAATDRNYDLELRFSGDDVDEVYGAAGGVQRETVGAGAH